MIPFQVMVFFKLPFRYAIIQIERESIEICELGINDEI